MGRRFWLYLAIITAIGVGLRLAYLDREGRGDEVWSVYNYARHGTAYILTNYDEPNNHVFHTLLMNATGRPFDWQLWAIRIPAFVAGAVLLPILGIVARNRYNDDVALGTVMVAATAVPIATFAVDARGYSIVLLCFLILLLYDPTKPHAIWKWGLFALVSAIGFFTVPVFVYPMGVVAAHFLLRIVFELRGPERWQRARALLLALMAGAVLTVLFYTPIILNDGWQAVGGNSVVTKRLGLLTFIDRASNLPRDLLKFISGELPIRVGALFALLAILGATWGERLSRERVPLIVSTVLWIAPLFFLQQVLPRTRIWVWLAPLYVMWQAAGLASVLPRRVYYIAVTAFALGTMIYHVAIGTLYIHWRTGYLPEAEVTSLALLDITDNVEPIIPVIQTRAVFGYHMFMNNGFVDAPIYWDNTELNYDDPSIYPVYVIILNEDPYENNRIFFGTGIDLAEGTHTLDTVYTSPEGTLAIKALQPVEADS